MTITPSRSAWRLRLVAATLLLAPLLGACGAGSPTANDQAAVPTVAPLFGTARPAAAAPIARPTATRSVAQPTAVPPTAAARPARDAIAELPIYSGKLAAGWSTEASAGMRFDLDSTAFVNTSAESIAAHAPAGAGKLCLTLKDGAPTYERSGVRGVSLWLSGGDLPLDNDALAVQMQGSNRYPYWVANDDSVHIDGRVTDDSPLFSETRLYFLGINRALPAKAWVEVVVWLDDLLYEPDYRYVTGVCVKNDPTYRDTFYVDRVALLLDDAQ